MEIAQTILNQIQFQDKWALKAWGASEYVALSNGVQFKIHTPLYQRGVRVKITLNSMDTYDIQVFRVAIRVAETKITILKTANGIYADMLIQVLDGLIEGDMKTTICF